MTRSSVERARLRRSGGGSAGLVFLAFIVALVVACTSTTSPSPTVVGPGSSEPSGSGLNPAATPWPSNVVDGVIALGAADSQFEQIGSDLQNDVNTSNLTQMLTDTTNILTFLTATQKNIPLVQAYGPTKSVGDRIATAYAQMIAGVQQIHDSLAQGNGAGVTAGFSTFVAGNTAYGAVRQELGDLANQAVFMKRIYYK
jgi:hypothetical protein